MSTRTKFLFADIIISCVLPGFLFGIVVVDDEIEAISRSSLCVQKRNKTTAIFHCRSRTVYRCEILTSLFTQYIQLDMLSLYVNDKLLAFRMILPFFPISITKIMNIFCQIVNIVVPFLQFSY